MFIFLLSQYVDIECMHKKGFVFFKLKEMVFFHIGIDFTFFRFFFVLIDKLFIDYLVVNQNIACFTKCTENVNIEVLKELFKRYAQFKGK